MLRKVAIRRKNVKSRLTVGGNRVRHHKDVPAHVGQDGAELVEKTVRSVMVDITSYNLLEEWFLCELAVVLYDGTIP